MNTPPIPRSPTTFFVHAPGYTAALEVSGVQAVSMAKTGTQAWSETYMIGYRFVEDLRTGAGYRVPNSLFECVKWHELSNEDRKQYEIRSPIVHARNCP